MRDYQGERRALLDEKKRWTGDFMAADSVSPLVKPASVTMAAATTSASASASASNSAAPAGTSAPVPPASPWRNFEPASPSPLSLSAHKRTPRTHVAGGSRRKAPKTPLSRLVLEKAVLHRDRDKDKAAAASGGSGAGAGAGNVFGAESSRRANIERDLVPGQDNVTERRVNRGKSRDKDGLGGSAMLVNKTLAQSTTAAAGAGKRDLGVSQSAAVGPRAAAAKSTKVWR